MSMTPCILCLLFKHEGGGGMSKSTVSCQWSAVSDNRQPEAQSWNLIADD
jgi:hypothetical protein